MRFIILTQEENLYLPTSFAAVCRELGDQIACVVSLPALSTHGGALKGFLKHVSLFGVCGSVVMATRILNARVRATLPNHSSSRSYYSIKQVACRFRIPFLSMRSINSQEFNSIIRKFKPELLVSMSCPQIIGKDIRDQFPLGCINVHGSPLPKYRGLMPAFWVLRNGEQQTAVTVHKLEKKLDDGEILLQREVSISEEDTWDSLVRKTKAAGARALTDAIYLIQRGAAVYHPNPEYEATYHSFPTASDRRAFRLRGRRFF